MKTKDARGWGAPFPEHLRAAGHAVAEPVRGIGRAFEAIVTGSPGGTPAAVAAAATAVLPQVRELHAALRSDFEKRHGEGAADSAHFRQFQAEYQVSFPAANLDAARDLATALEELETWARSGPGRASGSRGVLLLGGAGVGKTHGICDIAHDRFRRGLSTVVLFGEQFSSADEPWERIRQLLGFGPTGRDGILEALDAAGASSGRPLLLCIDGLNESRPRGYWRSWLAALAAQVARYPHIRLCVSCRSTYEPLSVPVGHGLERVDHVGFAGMEFTACRHYFAHYDLEPLVAPSFHPEFSNPLFLRLACQTLQAAGARRMPAGWHGLSTALMAFLRENDRAFAREHERDERERVPQRAPRVHGRGRAGPAGVPPVERRRRDHRPGAAARPRGPDRAGVARPRRAPHHRRGPGRRQPGRGGGRPHRFRAAGRPPLRRPAPRRHQAGGVA